MPWRDRERENNEHFHQMLTEAMKSRGAFLNFVGFLICATLFMVLFVLFLLYLFGVFNVFTLFV